MERVIRRNLRVIYRMVVSLRYIDKYAASVVSLGLSFFAVFAFAAMLSEFSLMSVARDNYSNNKEIEKISREIDTMKSELLLKTNIINIQRESKESGYIYNKDVKYVK
ncbi:hypothetical protein [Pseudostreptobacillus hongkongensis]|uniref:hypothetical protein n=1 Tax=Pseudostreptobacillus hongkongensis TaxID=1162717 RepID=UPI00082D0BEA|nr:hypothetical protein [Pseudostreptobacillus hongkongensis]